MKTKLFAVILSATIFFSCCGVKETEQDWKKERSDLQARIYVKDSLLTAYKDSLAECRNDNSQLHHWIESSPK